MVCFQSWPTWTLELLPPESELASEKDSLIGQASHGYAAQALRMEL